MTVTPEFVNKDDPKTLTQMETKGMAILDDIFRLGYTKSDVITVYKDEKTKLEITVQFRTLLPAEFRDVFEVTSGYHSNGGQTITEQVETLARSIIMINNMPLFLDGADIEVFKNEFKKEPTNLDQARYIILRKIQSLHIIELLYAAYAEFITGVEKHFEDVKKKLKAPAASESTSP